MSICTGSAKFLLFRCSPETLKWCLERSIFSCFDELISKCIQYEEPDLLQILIDGGGVVTQSHIIKATLQLSYHCLQVLCRSIKRWNPSNCVVAMQVEILNHIKLHITGSRMFTYYICQSFPHTHFLYWMFDKFKVHQIMSTVYDWCKSRHLPVKRWNSQDSVHKVDIKGEVDQYGVVLGKATNHNVACRGRSQMKITQCKFSPLGTCSTESSNSHEWMCNPSVSCSCGNRLQRRHSV